jgi:hypothetical protein
MRQLSLFASRAWPYVAGRQGRSGGANPDKGRTFFADHFGGL